MPRGLSPEFLDAFLNGLLEPILNRVKQDNTLDFQIRENEVHIYYRGGRILGITPKTRGGFGFSFDRKYFGASIFPELPGKAQSKEDVDLWIDTLPELKQAMDFFFTKTVEKPEREFQQLVVRENNYGRVSNDTDYFIVDCEYSHPTLANGKTDLVAFKWLSQSQARKKGEVRLAFIELKYGDSALTGGSGLVEHVKHMRAIVQDQKALKDTEDEMKKVFAQKRELGLVRRLGAGENEHEVDSFVPGAPEVMLLLINHDPAKSALPRELNALDAEAKKTLKVATANFMGYGLYAEGILTLEEFCTRYTAQFPSE